MNPVDRSFTAHGGTVGGTVAVPGDKSISHRAALFAALANGTGEITNFLDAADTRALLTALKALGVGVTTLTPVHIQVTGLGAAGWRDPSRPLDLGNSGTALRLLAGVLAGRGVRAVLTGDASLRRRPMARIVEPLARMGARITARDGCAPLSLAGGALTGVEHALPVASAQVVSCLLLAGLHADGETWVRAPSGWRDHTERMLAHYGVPVLRKRGAIGVTRCDFDALAPRTVDVPADPSSAAFFACAAALVPGAEVRLPGLCANSTRIGFVAILERMGVECAWEAERTAAGEPVADLVVRGPARLRATRVEAAEIPGAMDEIPVLLVVAAFAEGETRVSGAGELRHKESDRIRTVAGALAKLGADVHELPDGVVIRGGRLRGGTVDAHHDHRVAMAFAVASLRASGPVKVLNAAGIATSFPGFVPTARAAGLEIVAG